MSPGSPLLFLFDIDATLLLTSGSGYRSFVRSCREVLDISEPLDGNSGISMAGKLDRTIFHEIAARFRPGLRESELHGFWERFRERYLELLREESMRPDGWNLMPGVKPLVEFCNSAGRLALLTGNVREGAYIKLSVLGLDNYFPTGGFGEDNITRSQLAELAFEDACRYYKTDFSPERTFVLGDTVNDIRAARAIGAWAVAVATGTVSYEELNAARPDILAADFLSEAEDVRRFISSHAD